MGVLNGQPVSAEITNPAFINKNQNDQMPNILGFTRALSGPSIADIQQAVNNIYTATGVSEFATGTDYNATPNTISNGDSHLVALTKLSNLFAGATGHTHDGTDGNGPLLDVVRNIAASGFPNLSGDVLIAAGTGVQLFQTGQTIFVSASASLTGIAASGFPLLGGDVTLVAGTGVQITQSGQNITFSATGAGGGGGGGSLQWIEGLDSPTPTFENNIEVYAFDAGLGQQIFTTVRVPNSYASGTPIALRSLVYSPSATGTLLFQTQSTLIRPGTDAITSTTNQRTSTNSAINLSGATVNIPQLVAFDLSSNLGQINGVGVSPGDLIIVRFYRATDSATGQGKALLFASETSFT